MLKNIGAALKTAKWMCTGSAVECMKSPYLGRNGHIAIGTNNLERAIYHLGRQGVEFDESTRKPTAIYLKGGDRRLRHPSCAEIRRKSTWQKS